MLEPFKPSLRNSILETPLQFVKGVGPVLYEQLKSKNLYTIKDLLYFYPRRYQNRKSVHHIHELEPGQFACIEGEIYNKKVQKGYRWKQPSSYHLILRTHKEDFVFLKYFKLPYRNFFDSFEIGQKVKVCGVVRLFRGQIEFHHPEFASHDHSEKLCPVYSEIEGLSQKKIRNIIKNIFQKIENERDVMSILPDKIRKDFDLLDIFASLKDIHDPKLDTPEMYLKFQARSQKSLIFEELFKLQLYLGLRKLKLKKNLTQPIQCKGEKALQFCQALPFQWTQAQVRVFNEIVQDLNKESSMRRLIQGDVGCGKTSVVLKACCYAIEAGFQTALMVPTEILAEQHFNNSRSILSSLGIQTELLTSKVKNKQEVLRNIQEGKCQLCIGTQALIQEGVCFKKLGLVVIDEQHRFGVYQRDRLSDNKHCLVMTATPIPRTLAMTLYADLDVSVIDEMPKGRTPIYTRKTQKRRDVFLFLEKEVLKGRQAYVVYPLVEESEKMDLKNACLQFEKLKTAFPRIRWGLLHGKMSVLEKTAVMDQFVQNKIQALVTTTVIEVGIDVPNATVMVVEHSERFGLSQLHQLRGRVGRGKYKSWCFLILGKNTSREAQERACVMEKTLDGFCIAEEDLKLRGAGELMGKKQSGLVSFKIADLHRDTEILQQAKRAVQFVIDEDPCLEKNLFLKKEMESLSHI